LIRAAQQVKSCGAIGQALNPLHLRNKEGRKKKTMSFGLRKEDHMDSTDSFRECFETLEHRIGRRVHWSACLLGAALVVYNLATSSPVQAKTFHCGAGDVQCLIAAINEANANRQKKNTIRLEAGTYTLTAIDNTTVDEPFLPVANGLPVITSLLTITGQRAETTIIERDSSAPFFRILNVAAAGALTLQRLTVRGGFPFAGNGGGIFNDGILTIIKSTISQNAVRFPSFSGGGIFNRGTLTITNSTISSNATLDGNGGGIFNNGMLTITNSTISSNEARLSGHGIFNGGTLTVTNSTIVGNTPGVDAFGFNGGGIFTVGTVELQNTILALNMVALSGRGPDCSGPVTSLGNNLIGDPTGCTITLQPSDLTGDPGLGDFTDNGKPGNGHFPLLSSSQAIDAGNDDVCPKRDQLGRRRVGPCDIGAIAFRDKDDRRHEEEDDQQHEEDLVGAVQGSR
jgi:hypothetical protein